MNGTSFGSVSVDNGSLYAVILICGALVVFGYLYNRAVDLANPRGWLEPYTSLWVAAGVFVTLAAMGMIDLFVDWNAFFIGALAFAASGVCMIAGDIRRYLAAQDRLKDDLRRVYDQTDPLADQRRMGAPGCDISFAKDLRTGEPLDPRD